MNVKFINEMKLIIFLSMIFFQQISFAEFPVIACHPKKVSISPLRRVVPYPPTRKEQKEWREFFPWIEQIRTNEIEIIADMVNLLRSDNCINKKEIETAFVKNVKIRPLSIEITGKSDKISKLVRIFVDKIDEDLFSKTDTKVQSLFFSLLSLLVKNFKFIGTGKLRNRFKRYVFKIIRLNRYRNKTKIKYGVSRLTGTMMTSKSIEFSDKEKIFLIETSLFLSSSFSSLGTASYLVYMKSLTIQLHHFLEKNTELIFNLDTARRINSLFFRYSYEYNLALLQIKSRNI